MPIRVVHDHPSRRSFRRFRRRLTAVLGVLLIMAGLLAGAVPALFIVLALTSFVAADVDLPPVDAESTTILVVLLVVSPLCLAGGLRLARGRRSLVLFLRRFRLASATEALSYAAAHAIGRRWRVVTLDDADVAPVGVAHGARRVSAFGVWIAAVLVAAGVFWVFGGPFEDFLSGVHAVEPTAGTQSLGDAIGGIIATLLVLLVVGALVLSAVLLGAAFFGLVGVFSWSAHRAALRAERAKSGVIRRESEIGPYTRALVASTRGVLGPRLIVVRAAHHVWRDAVIGLAEVSEVVVVDLSDPSESLLWEIDALRRRGRPWILVGAAARLGPLAEVPDARTDLRGRLEHLLGDAEVLAYGEGRAETSRFARALRARLEDAV